MGEGRAGMEEKESVLTTFSVRPFHMSSPIALYCLLVVAIGVQTKRLFMR